MRGSQASEASAHDDNRRQAALFFFAARFSGKAGLS
jgi:hypothetical protein